MLVLFIQIANAEAMVQTLELITNEPANLSPLDVAITVSTLESLLEEALSNPNVCKHSCRT